MSQDLHFLCLILLATSVLSVEIQEDDDSSAGHHQSIQRDNLNKMSWKNMRFDSIKRDWNPKLQEKLSVVPDGINVILKQTKAKNERLDTETTDECLMQKLLSGIHGEDHKALLGSLSKFIGGEVELVHDSHLKETEKSEYCYSWDCDPYTGFAALTPYEVSANARASNVVPEGCTAKQLWIMIRSGSYNPHRYDISKFANELPDIRQEIAEASSENKGNLCSQDLVQLLSWNPLKIKDEMPLSLTDRGREEMAHIAKRFKESFPLVLETPYNSNKSDLFIKYRFAFAPSRQTKESADSFAQELFGISSGSFTNRSSTPLLQYLDECKKHIHEVLMVPDYQKPYHLFKQGNLMIEVLDNLNERLGFRLTAEKVRIMYNACRYLLPQDPSRPSPWCVVFTKRDLELLECWENIRMQFDYGPFHPIAYQPACVLVKDLVNHFKRRPLYGINDTNAAIYFVNTETIISFSALLGLFRDPQFLTDQCTKDSQTWQTSKFASFGSNIAFILSDCGEYGWWVSATVNETPIQLPGCETNMGCSFEKFLSVFDSEDCNIEELCGQSTETERKRDLLYYHYVSRNWV